MRKIILVAALVLSSAAAQAGERSLSLASSPEPVAAAPARPEVKADIVAPAKTAEIAAETPKAADAPTYVERPAAVQTKVAPAQAEQDKPAIEKAAAAPRIEKSSKPKRKRFWTEARIIQELHRHGIYW